MDSDFSDVRTNLIPIRDSRLASLGNHNLIMTSTCDSPDFNTFPDELNLEYLKRSKVTKEDQLSQIAWNKSIEDRLHLELVETLNDIHHLELGEREWKIIIGHWLNWHVNIVTRILAEFESVFLTRNISQVTFLNSTSFRCVTSNTNDFVKSSIDPHWMNSLTKEIFIHFKQFHSLLVDFVEVDSTEDKSEVKVTSSSVRSLKSLIFGAYVFLDNKVLRKFRPSQIFIINSYLPKKVEILTQLRLKQIPILRFTLHNTKNESLPVDRKLRNKLFSPLPIVETEDLGFMISRSLISQTMPKAYLEDFKSLQAEVNKFPGVSQQIKTIFTSNNFVFDENFKIWTALQIACHNTKYITGQHGNNYGVIDHARFIERETADKFVTWGWQNDPSIDVPLFNLKIATGQHRRVSKNMDGPIVVMQNMYPYHVGTNGSILDFEIEFMKQLDFVNRLPKEIYSRIKLRLHPNSPSSPFQEEKRWHKEGKGELLDCSGAHPYLLWKRSSLVIHAYDSTGLLESLLLNIPTLAYFENGLEFMTSDAATAYQLLVDVGIIHFTMDSLYETLLANHSQVADWWGREQLQRNVLRFCSQYSASAEHPSRDLANMLKGVATK